MDTTATTLPPLPPSLPPPPQPLESSEKALAVVCHLSFLLGVGFILPLVVFLVKRNESTFIAVHAREVLNFHLSLLIYGICIFPLVFILIGIPLYIALGLVALICAIVGAIRAGDGAYYKYPLTIRFI